MLDFEDDNMIHMSTRVQTTLPEAMQSLDQARERRRAELADWQPSGGWLVDRREARHLVRAGAR